MASRSFIVFAVFCSMALSSSAQVFDEALYAAWDQDDEPVREDILSAYERVKPLPEEEEFLQQTAEHGKGHGKFAFRFPPAAPHQGHTVPYPKGTKGSAAPFQANANKFSKEAKHEHRAAVTKAMEDAALKGAQRVFRKAKAQRKENSQAASVSKSANVAAAAVHKFKAATDREKGAKATVARRQRVLAAARRAAQIALQRKLAADALVRKDATRVAKAQQQEFSSKLKAESRGIAYKKAQATAETKDRKFKAWKQRQRVIKSVSADAVKAANAAIAKRRPSDMPATPTAPTAAKPAPKPARRSGHGTRPKNLHCNNANHFPAKYTKAGGGPQDCTGWSKAKYCQKAKYKSFMHTFCAKSCGCDNTAVLPTSGLKSVEMGYINFLMPPPARR